MAKKWNGSIQGMVISEVAHPELYAELNKTTHRDRTNRLRSLALVGLFALYNRVPTSGTTPDQQAEGEGMSAGTVQDTKDQARKQLKDKMLSSLSS